MQTHGSNPNCDLYGYSALVHIGLEARIHSQPSDVASAYQTLFHKFRDLIAKVGTEETKEKTRTKFQNRMIAQVWRLPTMSLA